MLEEVTRVEAGEVSRDFSLEWPEAPRKILLKDNGALYEGLR